MADIFHSNGAPEPVGTAVLAPGFDVQGDTDAADPGTLDSFYQTATQLNYSEGGGFPDNMVTTHNHVVWVVDYLDRRDAVQNNSLAVQALLKHADFNNSLKNNEKAVLFGYSMGGLVARHALLSLESGGFQHNMGAYVSLDAPHRGAFAPPAIEVTARTTKYLAGGGSGQVINKRLFKEKMSKAVDTLDSPAARQLLGIYIGKKVPRRYDINWYGGKEHTREYKNYIRLFEDMVADNDLTRHKSFFELREELVDLGAYPSRTLNIGVSFGHADGRRLNGMDPWERHFEPANFKVEVVHVDFLDVELNSIRGYSLCTIDMFSRTLRTCPALPLNNQHLQSVFVSPGSSTNTLGRTVEKVLDEQVDGLEGAEVFATALLAGPLTAFVAEAGADMSGESKEDELTFIPMVSAFDDKGWARDYPYGSEISTLRSSFDVLIADESDDVDTDLVHKTITKDLVKQITTRLSEAQVYSRQKNRIGGDGNFPNSPNSSYFNTQTGAFDFVRYIVPTSVRELPVVADAKASAYLSKRTSDDAIIAAAVAAM